MKHGNLLAYLLGTLLIVFYGCGGTGFKKQDTQKILLSPPYASVTDSIQQFPNNPDLYFERGTLLSQNNKHEIATADYKKAWELKQNDTTALQYVSNLLLVSKTKEAVSFLKDCITRFPNNMNFHRRLGELYEQAKLYDKALEQNDAILAKDSSNFESWYTKGQLLVALKDTSGGITALEHSYELQPVNNTGLAIASLYAELHDPKALVLSDEIIRKDTAAALADPYFVKGVYYSGIKQYKTAITQFDEAIKRDWKFTDAYDEKGIVLFQQKLYDSALHVFTMAATVSNTIADPYFWIGRCYEATGNKDQAIANYQRAIALDPGFVEAADRIKKLQD